MKLNSDFAVRKAEFMRAKQDNFLQMLRKYFGKVENIKVPNNMKYEDCDELFQRLCEKYSDAKKYFVEHEKKIKAYMTKKIEEEGAIIVPISSDFQHCYK